MQTTLINVSRSSSSSSSSFNLKNVDSDNDSAIRSTPSCSSSLGSTSAYSLNTQNSQKLKQPKIFDSLSDIRSYERKIIFYNLKI